MIQKVLGIIPARYESSRLPGKPLIRIGEKTMIQHVYDRSLSAVDFLIVATDDERIFREVESFGGKVVMTDKSHRSGTDRCKEAAQIYASSTGEIFPAIINIQGDEPFIEVDQIKQLKQLILEPQTAIATLVKRIDSEEELFKSSIPKVIFTTDFRAIYFSRHPIPFYQSANTSKWLSLHPYYKHIGMYAYKTEVLNEISNLPMGKLEIAESLEQLRWIENGYSIKIGITEYDTESIDTPADYERVLNHFKNKQSYR